MQISHSEKFEKKTDAVRAVEGVMEESLDQDAEIAVPARAVGDDAVTRFHEEYLRTRAAGNIASLPLRWEGEPVGVLTLERTSPAFDESHRLSLRLLCDQVASRMIERRRRDRWFGARWWAAACERAAKLVGVEHTGWKTLGLLGAVGLAELAFGRGTYRVEAPFILEADRLAQLPAAFDGYLEEVHFRVGSAVEEGAPLVQLDVREGRVAETDVNLIPEGAAGEVAFASRPGRTFPIEVERIEPLALPEQGGNVFVVRATFTEGAESWWRPGMSGLCKIEAGRRSYLWMLTRRTVDFLRLRFWW